MKEVYRTVVPGLAHTTRLALEAQGIEAVVADDGSLGVAGVAGAAQVFVADDHFEQARRIVEGLKKSPPPREADGLRRWKRLGSLSIGAGVILSMAGVTAHVGASSESGAIPLFAIAGALFLTGIVSYWRASCSRERSSFTRE